MVTVLGHSVKWPLHNCRTLMDLNIFIYDEFVAKISRSHGKHNCLAWFFLGFSGGTGLDLSKASLKIFYPQNS